MREVAIGTQRFDDLVEGKYFLVDKTAFLREWWRGGDAVTLICRPRRFGKTLTLDMARCFLSLDYAGRGEELFGNLSVWKYADMRTLQGTLPIISLSFARCKADTLDDSLAVVRQIIRVAVHEHDYLFESDRITNDDRRFLHRVTDSMDAVTATTCLGQLCRMLHVHWGVRPVILLDEYDTPMQEAWVGGWWDAMTRFMRQLFNATFKSNPHLGRSLITGVTRVASESIFSDMNNPAVITTMTPKYETAFGFTEAEVASALHEYDMYDQMDAVRWWYDGFTFGGASGIYNPWSITHLLDLKMIDTYWANSSSNALVSRLVQEGDKGLKTDFEALLSGEPLVKTIDERVNFRALNSSPHAIWALLLATGYLRAVSNHTDTPPHQVTLAITNEEVRSTFDGMVREWFTEDERSYNEFILSLLSCDTDAMNDYLSDLTEAVMSSFDSATHPSRQLPERFWHGLVLGLLVELRGRYEIRSNPESGYGRSDVILSPLDGPSGTDPAFVIEFKVLDRRRGERELSDTIASAHSQMMQRKYPSSLEGRGIAHDRIHCYGIAFEGKRVLIG